MNTRAFLAGPFAVTSKIQATCAQDGTPRTVRGAQSRDTRRIDRATGRDLPRRGPSCQDGGPVGSRQTPRYGDGRRPGLPHAAPPRRAPPGPPRRRSEEAARRGCPIHDRLGVAPATHDATPTAHPPPATHCCLLALRQPCPSASPGASRSFALTPLPPVFFSHLPSTTVLHSSNPGLSLGPSCPPRPARGAAHLSARCRPARPCWVNSLRSRRVRGSGGPAGRSPRTQRLSPLSLSDRPSRQ